MNERHKFFLVQGGRPDKVVDSVRAESRSEAIWEVTRKLCGTQYLYLDNIEVIQWPLTGPEKGAE